MNIKYSLFVITILSLISGQNNLCENINIPSLRAIYSIGDTISLEDQLRPYSICYSSNNIEMDTFRLANFNGNMNGGQYKITLISMNAAW